MGGTEGTDEGRRRNDGEGTDGDKWRTDWEKDEENLGGGGETGIRMRRNWEKDDEISRERWGLTRRGMGTDSDDWGRTEMNVDRRR